MTTTGSRKNDLLLGRGLTVNPESLAGFCVDKGVANGVDEVDCRPLSELSDKDRAHFIKMWADASPEERDPIEKECEESEKFIAESKVQEEQWDRSKEHLR
jgi:hypothetical protein